MLDSGVLYRYNTPILTTRGLYMVLLWVVFLSLLVVSLFQR
jgi:hypothetical protein